MALRPPPTTTALKKSSYYVWFLGAKESKGLRGTHHILPVIRHLEERERDVEPFKVTLQVSHKGLKIVQTVLKHSNNKSNANVAGKPKSDTIKHFIPHNTITCVHQVGDVVGCVLLLFNPVTECPWHVHAYRCDSLETAILLKSQLEILIQRPENQKKYSEIERQLFASSGSSGEWEDKSGGEATGRVVNGNKKKKESSLGSDAGTRESESSEERFTLEAADNTRLALLYDSVAAELREKLNLNRPKQPPNNNNNNNNNNSHHKNIVPQHQEKAGPILLPPRDYDTVHRQKGNLTGIELRRCLNVSIVGQNVNNYIIKSGDLDQKRCYHRGVDESGTSSGIGSDQPPSPVSPSDIGVTSGKNPLNDNRSSSDEDWNNDAEQDESTLYLHQVTLPRPSSRATHDHNNPQPIKSLMPPPPRHDVTYRNRQISPALNLTPSDRYYDSDRRSTANHQSQSRQGDSCQRRQADSFQEHQSPSRQSDGFRSHQNDSCQRRQADSFQKHQSPSRQSDGLRSHQNDSYQRRQTDSFQKHRSPSRQSDGFQSRDSFQDARDKFQMLEQSGNSVRRGESFQCYRGNAAAMAAGREIAREIMANKRRSFGPDQQQQSSSRGNDNHRHLRSNYRHSYAEQGFAGDVVARQQASNGSGSNRGSYGNGGGRVGIASVRPY